MPPCEAEEVTLAYGLLKAIDALGDKAPDCPVRERHLKALEESLIPLLPSLLAHDAYEGNIHTLVRDIIETGRVDLVKAAVEIEPENRSNIMDLVSQQRLPGRLEDAQGELIAYLAEEHGANPYGIGDLMAEVVRRGDRALFERVAAPFHPLEPFWSANRFHAMNAIDACHPELAPEIARRLCEARVAQSPVIKEQQIGCFMNYELKVVSCLLGAGCDMSQAEDYLIEPVSPDFRALIVRSRSAHGRMSLAAQEPDLVEMLCRPSEGGEFFGLVRDDEEISRKKDAA